MLSCEVFPDQSCKLKSINKLNKDEDIPEFIKDMFDEVVKSNTPVRETLAHRSIENLFDDSKKASDLTREIEQRFFGESGDKISLDGNEFEVYIRDVLRRLRTDETCKILFKTTFSHLNALLAQLVNGNDAFQILSQGEQVIRTLAELANRPDLDELIWRGNLAIEEHKHKSEEMQRKTQLGTHLENVLKRYLSLNVSHEVTSEQNGQDLIIYVDNQLVYYIEVKSKWREETPFRMSRNQTLQAHSNPDCYALCTIDMTQYHGDDKHKIESIEQVVHCMKFNTDVGTRVKSLVDIYKDDRSHIDDFRLDGDYRTYIPYWYIKEGIDLRAFEEYLRSHLWLKEKCSAG